MRSLPARTSRADGACQAARYCLVGINYKDEPENGLRYLRSLGLPYQAVGVDRSGRTAIDWGVYGVPETFVVDRQGIVRFKWVGPISDETARAKLEEAIRAAAG